MTAVEIAKRTAVEHSERSKVDLRLSDPRIKQIINRRPRIDHSFDIPYVAGVSTDMTTLYIDRDFPIERIEDMEALWLHEAGEAALMRFFNDGYDTAHRLITIAEKQLVERHGKNWKAYDAPFRAYAKHARHELIRRVPRDLFMAPYAQSGDPVLVRRMREAMRR